MELIDALDQTFAHASRIVAGVGADQLDQPTPCTEWTVRALLGHMAGVVANMGRGARGDDLLPDMNAFPLESDLGSQFRAEADRTLAAWRTKDPSGEVDVGAGPMPAPAAMSINLVDTATHSWDLAKATGQDGELPADVASTVLAVGQGFINDDIRKFAGIDPPVKVGGDATPTEQLAAFMGRQP